MPMILSKITSDYGSIQKFKHDIPTILKSRHLTINAEKTEEYRIDRPE